MFSTAPRSLRDVLDARAADKPDRLAFADAERSLTYAELDVASRELAAGLQAEGVAPGDRVAVVLPSGLGFVEIFWALQRLGAVPIALNPTGPPDRLVREIERLRPTLVVDPSLTGLRRPGATPDEPEIGPDDLAIIQPTSGTSGEPRAAQVTHRNLLAHQAAVRDRVGAHEDDVMVTWVPHWHDLGLIGMVIRSVHDGMPCHLVEPAVGTIPLWFQKIAEVRGTSTGAPDFALRLATRLIDPRRTDLSSLRVVTNGGEPVRSKTIAAFEAHFGLPGVVTPAYGLAEATCGVSSPRPGDPLRVDAHGHVSCGPPLDGVEVRAGDDHGSPAEILVRGDTVFPGYLDEPEATAEILRDGWLRTGDVGYRDADGLLYVLGRRRAMINRGGATLAPRELEEAAMTVAGVRVAAAVGVPSEASSTEELVVAVEVKEPDEAGGRVSREVSAAVRTAIGFAPERVLVLAPRSVPITANGKVRHARLQELVAAGTLGSV